MQHTQLLFNLENQTKDFSYTIFPVKKNKCWKNFKIMRKSLFNYSLYSHPEIRKFQGVTQYKADEAIPFATSSSRPTLKQSTTTTGRRVLLSGGPN
jgi:diaminopimelate decarboxylase